MGAIENFDALLTEAELKFISGLDTPYKIQMFLDSIPYSADPFYRCPLRVLRDRTSTCYDGAMFAASMLRRIGYPPLVLELLPTDRDDDHMLALYKEDRHWGVVAKSNCVGLRFREPVYRTLRELVMSYFDPYFNTEYEKTLRGYTVPLKLTSFDKFDWMIRDEALDLIANGLDKLRRFSILTDRMIQRLSLLDERSYQAGLLGSNKDGLYYPPPRTQ